MPQNNVARLQQADLVQAGSLTNAQRDALNDLTTEEVDCLISVSEKLGFDGVLPVDADGDIL